MGLAQAAVLLEFGRPLEMRMVELAEPGPLEVVIVMAASGLCHSDLTAQRGLSPRAPAVPVVLGHEVSGIVEAVGSAVQSVVPGDTVVACAASSCKTCMWCRRGLSEMCESMQRARTGDEPPRLSLEDDPVSAFVGIGGFATHLLVHEQAVVRVPESMPAVPAALLGCAVHTGIGAVRHSANVRQGDTVVVIGCGGVGLNVIQGARLAGASLIVAVDVDAAKLKRAVLFGANDGLLAGDGATEKVVGLTRGGADHAFDVVGHEATMRQAVDMVRPVGTVTILGLPTAGASMRIVADDLFAEKRIQGHRMGRGFRVDIPWYCERYLAGDLLLDDLVADVISLEDVNAGMEAIEGSAGRIVIRADG